jgi:hypothetical protein
VRSRPAIPKPRQIMEEETHIEKLARLSGKAASKALGALERRGFNLREMLSAPISRVPRRDPPPEQKTDD